MKFFNRNPKDEKICFTCNLPITTVHEKIELLDSKGKIIYLNFHISCEKESIIRERLPDCNLLRKIGRFTSFDMAKNPELVRELLKPKQLSEEKRMETVEILFIQGMNYFKENKFQSAISSLKQSLQLYPNSAKATLGIATSYHKLGKYDEAFLWYDKAISLQDDLFIVPYNKACIYATLGQKEETIQNLIDSFDMCKDSTKLKEMMKMERSFDIVKDDHRFQQLGSS